MNHVKATAFVLVAMAVGILDATPSFAASGVKIGTLRCVVQPGVGLIIGSRKGIGCNFRPSGGGPVEQYTGSITKVGLDVGITTKTIVGWAVFAPGKLKPGSLAGRYAGGSAEATLGLGLGANVLIGGSKKSVALQPISVQGQVGLNLAAGIAGLRLRYVGK
jgi:uncharacterized protein DUF992